jgi:cobalt-precorrin 5A hydrolase
MKIGIICFTAHGQALAESLCEKLHGAEHDADAYRCGKDALGDWTGTRFTTDDALVFVGAAGIAVRAIHPYIKSKTSDPAVIVLDECGKFIIPILSGHIGGANRLSREIAGILHALPVITTATDCNSVFAIDTWAAENGIRIVNPEQIKWISARLLASETVSVKSFFPVIGKSPAGLSLTEDEYDIVLTVRSKGRRDALRLVPPILTLGVGCRRGITAEELEDAYALILKKACCLKEAVAQVCSIDMKQNEKGLADFCGRNGLPLLTFSAEQLAAVPGRFSSSEFVRNATGVDNVCERSAVLGSGGALYVKKNAGNGITMALAIAPYTVRFMEE